MMQDKSKWQTLYVLTSNAVNNCLRNVILKKNAKVMKKVFIRKTIEHTYEINSQPLIYWCGFYADL